MSETKNVVYKPWAENFPSPYEGHDLTHRPDWANIIVWDAFFNNLTAGLMVLAGLIWFTRNPVFYPMLPIVLSVTLAIVLVDLLLLVFDLGDPWRFIHALRVLHFPSPLSVGVWGLTCYTSCLAIAVVLLWLVILWPPAQVLWPLVRLFISLAFIGAVVVICYKGVAFSCTSQPGVKDARWLTSFMVSDSLLMGCGLYAILCYVTGHGRALLWLALPTMILILARTVSFSLLWMDVSERARKVYTSENTVVRLMVYLIGGACAFVLAWLGPLGITFAGVLALAVGLMERYWIIGLTKKL